MKRNVNLWKIMKPRKKQHGSVIVDYSGEKYQATMIEMCRLLSIGMKNSEVSDYMKKKGFKYCSLSGIEKFIKHLKIEHDAKTLVHLIVKMKTKGFI